METSILGWCLLGVFFADRSGDGQAYDGNSDALLRCIEHFPHVV